jgi:hypothetical protein
MSISSIPAYTPPPPPSRDSARQSGADEETGRSEGVAEAAESKRRESAAEDQTVTEVSAGSTAAANTPRGSQINVVV